MLVSFGWMTNSENRGCVGWKLLLTILAIILFVAAGIWIELGMLGVFPPAFL
jgi:heme/copper-type cytochrome/quinol oxidase subunit 4